MLRLGNEFAEVFHHRDAEWQSFFGREGRIRKLCAFLRNKPVRPHRS
jgi:hypothetical protein